jgi:dienelactone hydrolase
MSPSRYAYIARNSLPSILTRLRAPPRRNEVVMSFADPTPRMSTQFLWLFITSPLFALCGCQDFTASATRSAAQAGLASSLVQGPNYQHQLFVRASISITPLFVFIDGDGSPWRHSGSYVSRDPTPHRALALELAARTPGAVIYLGRPCSFSARKDAACEPHVWTSDRYSAPVVRSMAAVINRYSPENESRCVVLVGYSGGGVLSVLIAPLVPSTCAVVTIAADLDVDAWTRWHHYLTLKGSLNPANQEPLDPHIAQWHLVGDRDTNVPPAISARYLDRLPNNNLWHFSTFDHTCCWVEQWPDILARIVAQVAGTAARAEPLSQPH